MAMKRGDSRTLLDPNETSSCLAYCDPSCPYSCPDYFPPPPPPPPSPFSPPPPAGDTPGNNHRFPPSVIIIMAFLGGAFLVVSYYVIISKSCLWYRTRRNRNHSPNNNDRSLSDQSDGGDDDTFDGTRIDHPIWYIRTIGLSQAVINSITLVNYDKSDGLIEGTDCTVCLSEFQEGETLRLLPKCNHAFHVNCIDTWLRSHVNCPLCRAQVVVSGHIVFDDDISSMSRQSLEESQRNIDFSGNLSSREENQMETTFVNNNNLGGSNSQVRNNSGALGVIPESVNDGGETLRPEGNSGGNDLKDGFVGSNGFTVRTTEVSDPIRSSISGQVLNDIDRHILVDVEEMRLARRAISMDSRLILSDSHMEEMRIDVDGGNGTIFGAMRNYNHQHSLNGDGCASVSTSASGSDNGNGSSSDGGASTTRPFSWSGRFFMHGIGRGAN